MKQARNKFLASGFTLLEMLLVAAVLAILAAISYPSYQHAVRKARRAEAWAVLLEQMQRQERFHSQHGSYIAFSAAQPHGFRWYSGGSPAASAYEISAAACHDSSIRNCVMLVATPGTDQVDRSYQDHACGKLTLSSTGTRSASGNATNCW